MYSPGVLMNAVSTGKANYATAIPVHASNAQGLPTFMLTYPQVHQDPPHQKNLIRAWGMPLQICYATRADDPV